MALGDKVIITCAVTGAVTTKKQCAAIPYTAVEIGEECRRAYEAGADGGARARAQRRRTAVVTTRRCSRPTSARSRRARRSSSTSRRARWG